MRARHLCQRSESLVYSTAVGKRFRDVWLKQDERGSSSGSLVIFPSHRPGQSRQIVLRSQIVVFANRGVLGRHSFLSASPGGR